MFFNNNFAFVCPSSGNDLSGNGSMEFPWKTLQRAVDEGHRRILLGAGNAGGLNASDDLEIYILGCGDSQIGGVTTNGKNIRLQDLGHFSFTVVHITTSGLPHTFMAAGNAEVIGVHFLDRVNTGANFPPVGTGNSANAAGSITARGCRTQRFDANGERGNDGDESTPSGSGGPAGLITCIGCEIEVGYEATPGQPGEDNGGGSGTSGNAPTPVMVGNIVAGALQL